MILKEIQPARIPASDIEVKLGATWIPEEYITQFIKEKFKLEDEDISVFYQKTLGKWVFDVRGYCSNVEVNTIYGTNEVNALDLTKDALNLHATNVYDRIDDKAKAKVVMVTEEKILEALRQIEE